MLKNSILLLCYLLCTFGTLKAQVMSADSIKIIAQKDVQKFKLDKSDLKTFRKQGKNSNSDFFKPTTKSVSNATLLNDSVYVATYRALAYKKTKRRKTVAHYILIGGIVYAVVVAIITIPVAVTH